MSRWWLAVVLLAAVVASHGLLRTEPLSGHDTAAFYANQGAFAANMKDGVWWPRWNGDGRYGYGEIKLQHRPPLVHFLAEPVVLLTGRNILASHLAVGLLVLAAAGGVFILCRRRLGDDGAAVAATAAVCATPFLANLYLRGAWYEVAAVAAMPWVLWANESLVHGLRHHAVAFTVGSLAWAALICGHPQVGLVFSGLAIAQLLLHAGHRRSWGTLGPPAAALGCGMLLAAPYWLVFWWELPLARMQLYDLGMESHVRHFLDLKALWPAPWPNAFTTYSGAVDYLGRPLHQQLHAFDPWTMGAMVLAPILWFGRGQRCRWHYRVSMVLWVAILACVVLALPLSWGLWEMIRPLQTFNFPWRTLAVANLCGALLVGVVLSHSFRAWRVRPPLRTVVVAALVAIILTTSWSRGAGWAATDGPLEADLQPSALRRTDGIPQHFHTPRWVTDYPRRPAQADIDLLEGLGQISGLRRSSTLWSFVVDARTSVKVRVNHHYYPGWRLESPDFPAIEAQPSETGLMEFVIPTGRHTLSLRFGATAHRVWACIAAGLGVGLILLVLVRGRIGSGRLIGSVSP